MTPAIIIGHEPVSRAGRTHPKGRRLSLCPSLVVSAGEHVIDCTCVERSRCGSQRSNPGSRGSDLLSSLEQR